MSKDNELFRTSTYMSDSLTEGNYSEVESHLQKYLSSIYSNLMEWKD